MTESQWIGLIPLGIGLGFVGYYVVVRWRRRVLQERGVAATGRVLSTIRESSEGGRGWISVVEYEDASGTPRRFDARGRFDGDVAVTYDPKRPKIARITTRSPYPTPVRWVVVLANTGLSVFVLMIVALLVAGVLLVTGLWELSDDALHGSQS